jgi:predicted DNA-binding transcriptional regulator AlpA
MSVLLNSKETAAQLRISMTWLNHSRQTGTGPQFVKVGHTVRYRQQDIDDWLESQARTRIYEFE